MESRSTDISLVPEAVFDRESALPDGAKKVNKISKENMSTERNTYPEREEGASDVELENVSGSAGESSRKKLDPSEVRIETATQVIANIISRMENDEIDLSPAFQRAKNLWNEEQQSRLIESILLQFPLPSFYFDGTNDSKWLVVDGLQRLCSISNFCLKKTLKLQGLDFLTDCEGKTFDQLRRDQQRKIREARIESYIIKEGTSSDIKYNLFKRINTGGYVLKAQEIRHALFQGHAAEFVEKLATMPEFIDATDGSISPDRMLDREFANRFLAFYFTPYSKYQPELDDFLNEIMEKINEKRLSDNDLNAAQTNFKAALCLARELFDDSAFRKPQQNGRRQPINKSLFEIWTVTFAKLSKEEHEKIVRQKSRFLQLFEALFKNDEFVAAITQGTGKINKVKLRFGQAEQCAQEALK
jgi:hypothetical protein